VLGFGAAVVVTASDEPVVDPPVEPDVCDVPAVDDEPAVALVAGVEAPTAVDDVDELLPQALRASTVRPETSKVGSVRIFMRGII
jgi:hypothetical protein